MHPKKQFFSTLLMACFMIVSIQAQNVQISFTGSGLSTTVDSVQVLNVKQGTSVTVKSSEGLNLVGTTTDIERELNGEGSFHIFPNPMTETSGIEFSTFRESLVNIEIFDVTGKIVIRDKQQLIRGNHKFEISGLNPGIYLVNVTTDNRKYTGNLIATLKNAGNAEIRYLGNHYTASQMSSLKSTNNVVQMIYNEGERLILKGVSGNHSRVVSLIPTQNQTVNFVFVLCTDGLGNHYPVVTIGTQTWMAENLRYLPSVSNVWTDGSYFNLHHYVYGYNGTDINAAKTTYEYQTYGAQYNFPAALLACPAGWHLPSDAEWTTLVNYLIANGYNYDGTKTGNKAAKSLTSPSIWTSTSVVGSVGNTDFPHMRNASGFSALPGGIRYYFGPSSSDALAAWWSSTKSSDTYAYYYQIDRGRVDIYQQNYRTDSGLSVRCIKN